MGSAAADEPRARAAVFAELAGSGVGLVSAAIWNAAHPSCRHGSRIQRSGCLPQPGRSGRSSCRRTQPYADSSRNAIERRGQTGIDCRSRRLASHECRRQSSSCRIRSKRRAGIELQSGHGNRGRQCRASFCSARRNRRTACRSFIDGCRRVRFGTVAARTL